MTKETITPERPGKSNGPLRSLSQGDLDGRREGVGEGRRDYYTGGPTDGIFPRIMISILASGITDFVDGGEPRMQRDAWLVTNVMTSAQACREPLVERDGGRGRAGGGRDEKINMHVRHRLTSGGWCSSSRARHALQHIIVRPPKALRCILYARRVCQSRSVLSLWPCSICRPRI